MHGISKSTAASSALIEKVPMQSDGTFLGLDPEGLVIGPGNGFCGSVTNTSKFLFSNSENATDYAGGYSFGTVCPLPPPPPPVVAATTQSSGSSGLSGGAIGGTFLSKSAHAFLHRKSLKILLYHASLHSGRLTGHRCLEPHSNCHC